MTTPGYLTGPGAREAAGLPPGTGPYRVVSNLGLMGFDDVSKRMKLLGVNPGVTVQDVIDNTGLVGIGTEQPAYNLDIVGTSRFSSYMGIGTTPGVSSIPLIIHMSASAQPMIQLSNPNTSGDTNIFFDTTSHD